MVSLLDGLGIVNGVIAVAGVGSMAGVIAMVRKSGAIEEGRKRDISDIKDSILVIQHDIGNGAFNGIKQNLATMQNNCTGEMATLKEKVANLEEDVRGKISNPLHRRATEDQQEAG